MNTFRKNCLVTMSAGAVLLLAGCSQSTQTAATEKTDTKAESTAPPEPVPAKTAFWPMYTSARNWSTDFYTLKLVAKDLPGFKSEAGKAPMWEATFASPSRHEFRVYTYAIASVPPDVYKGVVIGKAMPYNGVSRDAMPIQLSEFNTDSDAAYKAATDDAAAWLKKNPDKKLAHFELWDTYKNQVPTWFLMWGDKKSGYVALVNAATGKVLKNKT
jgi:hypothetical protein